MRTFGLPIRTRGLLGVALAVSLVPIGAATSQATAPRLPAACTPQTLVLSAMPVELSPLLSHERLSKTVTVGGKDYFVGRLAQHNVVLALTGIGPVNAKRTTRQALRHFRCVKAVVFSGVAGGDDIGDVIVPTHWTTDGKHTRGVSARLLEAARHATPRLEDTTPLGDPACACVTSPGLVTAVRVTHKPEVEVGGTGQTTDPFSGKALPCEPAGGDVFGCEPCPEPKHPARDTKAFATGAASFVDPAYLAGYQSPAESSKYVVEDEETAAVDAVAHAHHVPFLGIRGVSDGGGDPLHLPGFPVEFLAYRQLAADNAARVTLEVLRRQ